MATRKIPSNMNPWVCNINGVTYSYTAGSTQDVPDEVASLIDTLSVPAKEVKTGYNGQFWAFEGKWEDLPEQAKELPKIPFSLETDFILVGRCGAGGVYSLRWELENKYRNPDDEEPEEIDEE